MIAIILGLGLLVGVVFIIRSGWNDDWLGTSIFVSVMALVFGALFAALILSAIASPFPAQNIETDRLQALANGDSVSGHFFLGSGYIKDEQVFNYVEDHGGYSTLEQVEARKSRVYQDEQKDPRIELWEARADAWWLAPFTVGGLGTRYDFHIPTGSIDNTYSVKP